VVIVLPRPVGVCLRARLSSNVRHTTGTAVPHHRRARPWAAQYKTKCEARLLRRRTRELTVCARLQACEGCLRPALRLPLSIVLLHAPQTIGHSFAALETPWSAAVVEAPSAQTIQQPRCRPALRQRRLVSSVVPNQSLKPTRYGRRCKPGLRQSYYRRSPGSQHLPPRAA
jgi:hypothetical protein